MLTMFTALYVDGLRPLLKAKTRTYSHTRSTISFMDVIFAAAPVVCFTLGPCTTLPLLCFYTFRQYAFVLNRKTELVGERLLSPSDLPTVIHCLSIFIVLICCGIIFPLTITRSTNTLKLLKVDKSVADIAVISPFFLSLANGVATWLETRNIGVFYKTRFNDFPVSRKFAVLI